MCFHRNSYVIRLSAWRIRNFSYYTTDTMMDYDRYDDILSLGAQNHMKTMHFSFVFMWFSFFINFVDESGRWKFITNLMKVWSSSMIFFHVEITWKSSLACKTAAFGNEKCDFLHHLLINFKSDCRFAISVLISNFYVISNLTKKGNSYFKSDQKQELAIIFVLPWCQRC